MNKNKKQLIKRILNICHKSKEGHLGSSLSILDILYVIYDKFNNKNNKFVLSKGHSSLGLYAVLEHFKLLDENLDNFCQFNSLLGGHPSIKIKNVECSTGSLGHGMPIAIGIAMYKKINLEKGKVITIIGDGEANEGTIWESALLASHHKLNNFYCIMDYNHSTDRALNIDNVTKKFKSFGWHCLEIDGHSEEQIIKALNKKHSKKPIFILANTIKGKGCSIMENNPEWHHKTPNEEELKNLFMDLQ